ncbi:endonuclease/exonuclease/phosphatase family protein [Paeniglutamicibacter psychrophenolicus]|uniref:Endonuclease/exonuclease/phosphatase (EEP) superfamily protein YafD n=1 Tax=Paeniglutamicibacter psychrophenolicus TaxID=257454 RepID=A0ABS4WCT4_9MICC|nr:endonuclease/exonuclease/phosphatase family protein [Paeniglutamicibacter psychrophenolicus]MBP2374010.1 endonuclease/exonuclease/phosphatase (EEP) superfamily protein YafD [Paeniglutamicibacter psychrophenolicus]
MGNAGAGRVRVVRAPKTRGLLPLVLAGALLAALPHLDFAASRSLAVLQALLPVLCLAALALGPVLAYRRAWIPATVLLGCTALSLAPVLQPVAGGACGPGEPVTVLSLNAGRGHADPSIIAAAIIASAPDVLVLVEASEPMLQALATALPQWHYTNRTGPVVTGGAVDTVILSKHPMHSEAPAARQSAGSLFDVPVAAIDHPRAGRIRVAGIHPVPPTHGPDSWAGTLATAERWTGQNTDLPLVLAGDFNATRAHPGFRALAHGFSDASPAFGPLAAATWPANGAVPAFAAIDHVLVRGLGIMDSSRIAVEGTDHLGIVAKLSSCR